jgi:hypothetical protein
MPVLADVGLRRTIETFAVSCKMGYRIYDYAMEYIGAGDFHARGLESFHGWQSGSRKTCSPSQATLPPAVHDRSCTGDGHPMADLISRISSLETL